MRKTALVHALILVALMLSRQAVTSPISANAEVVSQIRAQKTQLTDIKELAQLKGLFEKDRGKVRLIALLSPN